MNCLEVQLDYNENTYVFECERAQSYLSYDKMKMYVHGLSPWITNESSKVEMFMRFGFGKITTRFHASL